MITGFARCLRRENAGLRFITLDLDEENQLPDYQVGDTISRVFCLTFGSDTPSSLTDTEFLEAKGLLQIPRAVENQMKDDYVVRENSPPVPEPQPFIQPGRPLEVKVGQVGLLDSVFFQDDPSLKGELESDEIEISIKSTGMNFKDIMIALGQIPFYHKIVRIFGIHISSFESSFESKDMF